MNRDENNDPLGLLAPIERREMLGGMLAGGALALSGCGRQNGVASLATSEPQNESGYYPPERMGLRGSHPGSFENAHALRDGALKPEHAKNSGESYDLVVVGGGISGLSAAYFMHAANPDARSLPVTTLAFGQISRQISLSARRSSSVAQPARKTPARSICFGNSARMARKRSGAVRRKFDGGSFP